ncbi:uncharacterized protein PAN0_003c2107 [Moesziomyces antarcticus]|uniref:Uncharacterized protein n=1 Tax=Pseudozyma antarctica TaxID=84753 RepID=A0A5C3FJI2_PSEA2|nr:uncharacterized protein PAN0_003c2107 [Moesziomyces antarcticus]GAK63898.1 conserved hypothetical protein [Moesziomyces antarcticus]SPO44508.1 uncharacterized protein PSANT_02193 [Moesziomyces antarcticus]
MADHASNQGAADPRAPSHTAGRQRSADPDEAQLPLLSDTDHDIDDQPLQHSDVPPHRHANKDSRDDWHWLERLVFKTRFHFIVSVTLFFVFWTFVALIFSGDWPGNDIRWPWSKRPGNRAPLGNDFYEAQNRLSNQPFCHPKVGILQLNDVQTEQPNGSLHFDIDRINVDGFERRSTGWPCIQASPWHSSLGSDFDKLAGTTVREAAKRRRETMDLVMSIAQGAPFYTRKATECSSSSSLHPGANTTDHQVFRSRKLWQAVQQLAWAASLYANDGIMPEQMLQALRLDHTRIVREAHRHSRGSSHNQTEALQTTILDAQKFVQSLLAIYYGLEQPAETFLNDAVIHHFFTIHELSTDSSTGSTHSPFDLVRKDLPRRYTALSAVGHLNFGNALRLQQRNKPFQLYVLHEVYGDHELDIALDLERGLIVSTLARLALDHDETQEGKDCQLLQESKSQSPWDWLLQSVPSVLLDITWRLEERDRASLAGTYRYESGLSNHSTANSSPASFEWVEVDVGMEDAVPWITRIEYAPVRARPSSASAQVPFSADQLTTDKSNGSVSVLKKYNVGGTADFFAGWTCKWSQDQVADCYRPRVGEDDSRCSCKDWRTGATSSYRVGLWPVQEEGQVDTNVFHIPPAAIRLDGNSYMDQGVGGCSALFTPDEEQHVPEMEAFGYTLKFTEPERNEDGTIRQETQLEWLEKGLKMTRVPQLQRKP